MLGEIGYKVDEFCQREGTFLLRLLKGCGVYRKKHKGSLSLSEVMTILIFYY
jgi:hypothetical protein